MKKNKIKMKHTVESLEKQGYIGCMRNEFTGNLITGVNFVLDNIAWTMNNKPYRLKYTNHDISGKVSVRIENENWIPEDHYDYFAERPMTNEEIIEADKRLAEMGMSVDRKKEISK